MSPNSDTFENIQIMSQVQTAEEDSNNLADSDRNLFHNINMDQTLEKYQFEEGKRRHHYRRRFHVSSSPTIASNHSPSSPSSTSSSHPVSTMMPNLKSLIYYKKWDECMTRITNFPQETRTLDPLSHDFALHEACQSGAPFHVIQHLIHTNPSALSTKGFCGRLPLHYCSYVKPTVNVIKLLLRYYHKAASIFDDDGRLPLHLAVLRNAPNLVIQTLIDANPMALISLNKFGNTPDMICQNEYIHSMLEVSLVGGMITVDCTLYIMKEGRTNFFC